MKSLFLTAASWDSWALEILPWRQLWGTATSPAFTCFMVNATILSPSLCQLSSVSPLPCLSLSLSHSITIFPYFLCLSIFSHSNVSISPLFFSSSPLFSVRCFHNEAAGEDDGCSCCFLIEFWASWLFSRIAPVIPMGLTSKLFRNKLHSKVAVFLMMCPAAFLISAQCYLSSLNCFIAAYCAVVMHLCLFPKTRDPHAGKDPPSSRQFPCKYFDFLSPWLQLFALRAEGLKSFLSY